METSGSRSKKQVIGLIVFKNKKTPTNDNNRLAGVFWHCIS